MLTDFSTLTNLFDNVICVLLLYSDLKPKCFRDKHKHTHTQTRTRTHLPSWGCWLYINEHRWTQMNTWISDLDMSIRCNCSRSIYISTFLQFLLRVWRWKIFCKHSFSLGFNRIGTMIFFYFASSIRFEFSFMFVPLAWKLWLN